MLPRFLELYHDTRNRSEWQFEELTSDYFTGILSNLPENAFCTVYRVGDDILAFNLLLHNRDMLIDKFFCMDAIRGRPYNLYYVSWFENLRFCLEHGLTRYQSGQAYYRNKLRLGSMLTANAMFFRHQNPVLHAVLKWISPLFSSDGLEKQ
jgi:predicted N-acyltransferase